MKKIFIIIILFCIFTPRAFGADFSFDYKKEVLVGEIFSVSILLDTKNEIINSAEVNFTFNPEKLEFMGYKDEGGVLKLWIDVPKNKDGKISFSGIIPGGVEGTYDPNFNNLQKLNLVNLLFKAKTSGVNNFNFTEAYALKNDGVGTKLPVEIINDSLIIKEKVLKANDEPTLKEEVFDNIPPEVFKVYFSEAIPESKTPSLIVFSAVDKGTGVQKYQIRKNGIWIETYSPLEVNKSFFDRSITVRAVDYAGNVRDSVVVVPGSVSILTFFIVLIAIAVGFYGRKLLKYKYGKKL